MSITVVRYNCMMSCYVKKIYRISIKKKYLTFLVCYAMKFGTRGYGHIGISSMGLMSDAKDLEYQRLGNVCLRVQNFFPFPINVLRCLCK